MVWDLVQEQEPRGYVCTEGVLLGDAIWIDLYCAVTTLNVNSATTPSETFTMSR